MRLKKLQDYKVNNSERIKKEEIPFLKYLNKLYLVKSEKGDYINLESTTFVALHEALKQLKIDKAEVFLIKEKDIVVLTDEGTLINPFENYRQEKADLEIKETEEEDKEIKEEEIDELLDEEKEPDKLLTETNEYYLSTKTNVPPKFNRYGWSKKQKVTSEDRPFVWQAVEMIFSDGTTEISEPALISQYSEKEVTEEVEPNEAKNLHGNRPEHE